MGSVNFNLDNLEKYDLIYLSLGAGLQSSVLYYMACMNFPGMPKISYAAFSDPGDEPQHTYQVLRRLKAYAKRNNGPKIHCVSKDGSRMSDSIFNKDGICWASVPGYTKGIDGKKEGMLRRQCTREYKIEPLTRFAKEWCGVKRGERMGKRRILTLQGITTYEAIRMKPPREVWGDSGYPLVSMRMSRFDCAIWLKRHKLKPISKSACVYCPYHGNAEWREVKSVQKDWDLACRVDEAIRESSTAGAIRPVYLHRSCVPLKDAFLDEFDGDLFAAECDGVCGL